MPIQEGNIVFVKSQVMDDVPEGGGAATGTTIVDGQLNNVFEDISDLARAYGQFNLRKIFLAVRALNTDLYGGAKTIITALPEDPALSYTLFSTNDAFDTRSEAADRVEAYLYKGPLWPGALNENHLTGMRAISVIQRVGSTLPVVGKTLCLTQNEGLSNEAEQYIRVIKVSYVETAFTDASGDYSRWIVRMDLSDSLRYDFLGHTANRTDTYTYTGKTRLRDTSVADAATYVGSQPLVESAAIADRTLKVASVYTQLVPSTQTETPITDAQPTGATLTVSGGTRPTEIIQIAETRSLTVTAENRALNWVFACNPLPALNTVTVSYRALGNWYTIVDSAGDGTLNSESGAGVGTISFTTGSGSVTLAALPDVGSAILISWGTPVHYESLAGLQASAKAPHIAYTVLHPRIKPSTLSVQYVSSGVTKTATEAGAGTFAGDGSGPVDYTSGRIYLTPSVMPDANSAAIVAYTEQAVVTGSLIVAAAVRTFVLTLPVASDTVKPGSFKIDFAVVATGIYGKIIHETQTVTDDGLGGLMGEIVQTGSSIDYAGTVTLVLKETIDRELYATFWNYSVWYENYPYSVPVETTTFAYQFSKSLAAETVHSETLTLAAMTIDLSPLTTDAIVPNSLQWTWGGRTYYDQDGSIYYGTNTLAGSINYATQLLTLTDWPSGAAGGIVLSSGLASRGQNTVIQAYFRAPGSPLRSQSLQISATDLNGNLITGTADADSAIVGTWMSGTVELEYGVIAVRFGKLVLDSSLTAEEKLEDWYDAGDIVGGSIFKPLPVNPATIRFNCVLYAYLPLDASILGIDAVRLPSDGRVPIYRAGNLLMVIHPVTNAAATPALNGTTGTYELSCGRTRIAWVKIVDAAGDVVADGYTLDRATGVVAWETLVGLVTPVTLSHTVGDLRMISDVQIDGTLTLSRALSHAFPADESLACACLIHGDRRARVSSVWDQASWDSTWADTIVGSAATATLNTIDFPITVTNEGCDTDRWLLRWTSTTAAELISEKRGLVWAGSYPAYASGEPVDIAPINPRTRVFTGGVYTGGVPYLTIPQRANGGGWSTGNVVRINTVGAIADFWIARSVGQSDEPLDDGADGCEIYALGNIDRP